MSASESLGVTLELDRMDPVLAPDKRARPSAARHMAGSPPRCHLTTANLTATGFDVPSAVRALNVAR